MKAFFNISTVFIEYKHYDWLLIVLRFLLRKSILKLSLMAINFSGFLAAVGYGRSRKRLNYYIPGVDV